MDVFAFVCSAYLFLGLVYWPLRSHITGYHITLEQLKGSIVLASGGTLFGYFVAGCLLHLPNVSCMFQQLLNDFAGK